MDIFKIKYIFFQVLTGNYDDGRIELHDSKNQIFTKAFSDIHNTRISFLKYLSNGTVASAS